MLGIFLSGTQNWWVFLIVAIFLVIGAIVFFLRKKIPGLAEYDKEDEGCEDDEEFNFDEDEETIAKDNLSRILVDVPEKKDEKEEKKTDDENK